MAMANYTIMTLQSRDYQYKKYVDIYRVLYMNLKAK